MNEFLLRCYGIGTRLSLFLIGFLLAFSGWAQTGEPTEPIATVSTDREDYQPGDYVIITGTDWKPGEWVDFTFEETPKPESCVNSHDNFTQADDEGNIYYDQFLIKDNHLGVTFLLTATGRSSGSTATTTFTDALLYSASISSTPSNICAGSNVSFTITINNNTTTGQGTTGSNARLGSVKIAIPTGFTSVVVTAKSLNWSTTISPGFINFSADGNGDRINPGSSVFVTFTAVAPNTVSNPYVWTTDAWVSIDFTSTQYPTIGSIENPGTPPSVTVNPKPTPTFSVAPGPTSCLNTNITYTTQTGNSNYAWIFPGTAGVDYTVVSGGTSTDISTTIKYLTSGSKTVTVNYQNSNGCTGVSPASSTTNVNALVIASFINPPTTACIGESVTYTTQSGKSNYVWSFPGSTTGDYSIITGGTTTNNFVTLSWTNTGSRSVSVLYSDNTCPSSLATANTTVNPNPTVTNPGDKTELSCQTQAVINTKFNDWLDTAIATNGTPSNNNSGAPSSCGGTTTVTFTSTSTTGCGSDTQVASFTVTPAPVVTLTAPVDGGSDACSSQTDVDAAFALWLAEVQYGGGCGSEISNDNTGAPLACGGSTTVTWTVSSDCEADVTASATYTVTPAPVVTLTAPVDGGSDACSSQTDVDAAFALWLAEVQYGGGCGSEISNDNTGAPLACGGSTTVTWTVSSDCEADVTASATYTVTPAPVVTLTAPVDGGSDACSSQTDVDAAFALWLAEVQYGGGCGSEISNDNTGAPLACGGSTTVTWTVSSDCEADVTASATYTVTPAPVVTLTAPVDGGSDACSSQTDVDAAFALWLAEVQYGGGCGSEISNDNTGAPSACGGSTTVTWTVSSDCEADVTASATYTVTPAPAVVVNKAVDNTTSTACDYADQAAAQSVFDLWLATASVSGGCSPTSTPDITTAPAYCGGSVDVTWAIEDACYTTSTYSATFTINETTSDLGAITPINPQALNQSFELKSEILGDGCPNSAKWYFSSDGAIVDPLLDAEFSFTGTISGNFVQNSFVSTDFSAPGNLSGTGVYSVMLVLYDDCNDPVEESYDFVVIYDPSGGFVTGGGWFYSNPGNMPDNPTAQGRANFGFNAKYKSGKNNLNEVDGNTNFQFKEGDFHFKSSSHKTMSLVISGERKATYKGSGTVNGMTGYDFMVTVIDGEAPGAGPNDYDSFRIKVWVAGSPTNVVYDNELGDAENADATTELGGGSIVIHKPKGNSKAQEVVTKGTPIIMEDLMPEILESLAASPNPVVSYSTVRFSVKEDAIATLRLFDHSGRMIETLYQGNVKAFENYDVDFQRRNLMSGIYIVKLTTTKGHSYEKRIIIN